MFNSEYLQGKFSRLCCQNTIITGSLINLKLPVSLSYFSSMFTKLILYFALTNSDRRSLFFLVAKATQAYTDISNSVSHTFSVISCIENGNLF